ncbi:pyridine nucleotide-disulfide oxidoreductase [Marinitoga sp. 1135]|uniref:Pyruvate/2-oxoglutarate dehydrogenase complex, dihydrolipoamide dehydrogenase component n=1 Tax=Marinitoga piezophila (strain DSM 14283 / JCM 11233 / KA3) TaxID=443254 RepID=H2J886_MARPK|nr:MULTISPECIES: FAD-dependent oxidoreductase [Marinitoga]AEX85570.1 pyruvate/2-oxoglutarate dehydrogenase complex, dihydrolipoamide dehydrogenase component [Marinitoga piezophila KA3]APT76041.1 pyridine nucleotide-disulfide oxidoreductase [Marinitoga sp. 1137]NUU95784.1 pyridine nucleotide-disulfide oxidoreductase [Marinitoga sp. 1135]NUU97707.1 pyridine nucleotide-disulfide oxidoreductase [Marinitoga sp. 1138]
MKYDIIVIGGSAAGLVAAMTSKKIYKDKKVLVIKKLDKELVPCGIPYIFHTLGGVEKDYMGIEEKFKAMGIDLLIDEVIDGDAEKKTISTKSGKTFEYEKLIIATGSTPFRAPIPGNELENVLTIPKDHFYLETVHEKLKDAKNVVIIGGGFIGVEVADEIKKAGKNVTLIEARDYLLPASFDKDFGEIAREEIESDNVKVLLNSKVKEIAGNGKVEKVVLDGGEEIPADVVILATGYKPNVEIGKKMGLKITDLGYIETDDYMRTSVADIYAAGDCVQHKDYFTGKPSRLMLASAAVFDARIAASNLYKLRVLRTNKGSLNAYSTVIGGKAFAAAGITEAVAKQEGFDIVVGKAEVMDRHPGKFADASKIVLKLIFSKESGLLLGAQMAGGKSIGEMINIISLAIQKEVTVQDIMTMQIGTHPLLTAAPTVYPLSVAAEQAFSQM